MDLEGLSKRALCRCHRCLQQRCHPAVPLQCGNLGSFGARRASRAGVQLGRRGESHRLLSERRQHLLHIPQEDSARADEQHTLPLETGAVGEQQIGGAMKRDGRLPGPRSALDDEGSPEGSPDDGILLALDGGDDVAHTARAAALETGEKGGLTDKDEVAARLPVEQLVFDGGKAPSPEEEVTAADDPEGIGRCGPVERLGDRSTPVDDERVALGVEDGQAADMESLAVVAVEPPEGDRGIADIERRQPAGRHVNAYVTLHTGGERPSGPESDDFGRDRTRRLPHHLEPFMCVVEIGLLGLKFGVDQASRERG